MNQVEEGTLHKWFKSSKSKDGKPGWVNVVTGGTCASDEPGEGVPKCVSSKKRASMTPKQRRSAARRKKRKDKNQQKKRNAAKPTYVSTDKPKKKKMNEAKKYPDHEHSMIRSELQTIRKAVDRLKKKMKGEGNVEAWVQSKITKAADYIDSAADYIDSGEHNVHGSMDEQKDVKGKGSGKKDACYRKVKARYDVWPSAYASGALVKCRKVGASNWGNKSESYEFSNWRDDFKATEYEFVDIIEAEPLIQEQSPSFTINPSRETRTDRNKKIENAADANQPNAQKILRRRGGGPSLPGRFDDMKKSLNNSVEIDGDQLDEAGKKCWKGYEKKGTQKLFGKTYNRCVKAEEVELPPTSKKDLKKKVEKSLRRVDADVDGDVDSRDMKSPEMGEYLPLPDGKGKLKPKVRFEEFSDWRSELEESKIDKDKMKCDKPKAQAVGDSKTGKSHVVKACEGGKEKIIRFGQRGVKGSPKKKGESKAYASRRKRFKSRHAKNIAKGKMSAAYWSDRVKW